MRSFKKIIFVMKMYLYRDYNYFFYKKISKDICECLLFNKAKIKITKIKPFSYSINPYGFNFCYVTLLQGDIYIKIEPNKHYPIDYYFKHKSGNMLPKNVANQEKEKFYNSFFKKP